MLNLRFLYCILLRYTSFCFSAVVYQTTILKLIWDQLCSSVKDLGTYNSISVLCLVVDSPWLFCSVEAIPYLRIIHLPSSLELCWCQCIFPFRCELNCIVILLPTWFSLTLSCRIKRCIIQYLHLMGSVLYLSLCMWCFDWKKK